MSLNIGGSVDQFFRYKMPDIQVKIEGRGNGIKTVIPNMADIGIALKRDPAYPTKYFATELGALSLWDEKRNVGIVNGEHSKETLAKLLADFINRYVLCPQCKLPETDLKVKGGQIHAKCKACGYRGLSDNKHRVATYIINHPPNKEDKDKKDAKHDAKADGKSSKKDKEKSEKPEKLEKKPSSSKPEAGNEEVKKEKTPDQPNGEPDAEKMVEDDGEIHFEITDEMRNMKVDENAHLDDPVELVSKMLSSVAGQPLNAQLAAVRQHQSTHFFDNALMFQYFMKAIVSGSMAKQVKANLPLLQKLTDDSRDNQRLLLSIIEERCEEHPENLKDVSSALMMLYDVDLLDEETILTWHEKGTSQLIALADQRASMETRKAAEKFVEWLKNAEEDEDEDEDDE